MAFSHADRFSERRQAPTVPVGWQFPLAAAACLGAVLLVAGIAQDLWTFRSGDWAGDGRIWLLDVDVEQSAFTWISVLSLAAASAVLYLVAFAHRHAGKRLSSVWFLLSLLFLGLSLDEHVSIHEKLSELLSNQIDAGGLLFFAWAAPAGLISLAGMIALIPFFRILPKHTTFLIIVSGLLFLTGAVVLEMIEGMIVEESGVTTPLYRTLVNIEEGLEYFSVLLFIYALLRYRDGLATNTA